MATITAAHFVSRASHVSSETKASPVGLQAQSLSHHGLRAVNTVDKLQIRTKAKAIATRAVKKSQAVTESPSSAKIVCGAGMNLVFVSSECGPWSKTGGLGDVLGGLPAAMAARGHRVMTVCPRYDQYKDAWDTCVFVAIQVGDKVETVRFFHCHKRGVDRVFVDHPLFLEKVWGKTGSKIYGPTTGIDYRDNQLRFSMLCQAALEAPRVLNLNSSKNFSGPYGDDVLFIANDWHTALLPCYLKTMYQPRGFYTNAKVAFCIHNIAYQGRFAFADFSLLNLPDSFKGSFDFMDGYNKPVKGRKINWMKAGILESDRVVTVSPYYAQELVSGEDKGVELDNVLRTKTVTGIANGMDVQEWDPATDKYIDVKYDATTVCRHSPSIIASLDYYNKGGDVDCYSYCGVSGHGCKAIVEGSTSSRVRIASGQEHSCVWIHWQIGRTESCCFKLICDGFWVQGTGKKYMEEQIEQLEKLYPDKVRGVAKFNVPLAHMITAGADFMLVPSRFEPCGLIQLHAMRYGTVPCVASTGGLVDTVKEGYTGFQMGAFNVECDAVDPADVQKIVTAVKRVIAAFGTPAVEEMIQNGMAQDLSWKGPARLWEKMLLGLGAAGSEAGVEGEEIAPLAKENVATP
ncbi:unnamed protein product [Linum tenue]|uniref:Starch synthase, chloroplastic/amyloplastic n=1 Tax=Linum tenue TaxID=586396 RepID=A0AAV0JG87_9ROSI|nr:unnamed protein product [Linum tenue]